MGRLYIAAGHVSTVRTNDSKESRDSKLLMTDRSERFFAKISIDEVSGYRSRCRFEQAPVRSKYMFLEQ